MTCAGRSCAEASATGGVNAADYSADGDGILAALGEYDGDVWLADGVFP